MPKEIAPEIDEAELAVFVKKIKQLAQYKGRGTELISLYLPPGVDRSQVSGQLSQEMSQSTNIKSQTTRKNVGGALRKIDGYLKQIDWKLPATGLVVFGGNVSPVEGRTDIRLFTIKPPIPLKTKLYWCDSAFHLDPLTEMMKPKDVYGLLTMDKNEATIALLQGKKYEIIASFTSQVAGKTRAGGQSAQRFEHLREEAAKDFYRKISEKVNQALVPIEDRLKGMIIGGPGVTKQYFLNRELIDHRIRQKIIAILDVSYTDEFGIRELVQKSEEVLRETDLMKETQIVNAFLEQVAKGGLATYGEKQVIEALERGQIKSLLVSDSIDLMVHKAKNVVSGEEREIVTKPDEDWRAKGGFTGTQWEKTEEVDYLDWLVEKAHKTGADVKVISTDTPEGSQFAQGFGGLGGILRYR